MNRFFKMAADANMATLPHQERAMKKLEKTDAILLMHGVGTGKTATSIAMTNGAKTDVVVPAGLRGNYTKELAKFKADPSTRNIQSYNRFTKMGPSKGADYLVMDEPQMIGNAGSKMSQAAVAAASHYKKRILLSATPALNHPHELAPIVRMLSPGAKNVPLNPTEFNNRFIGEKKHRVGFFGRLVGAKPGIEYFPKNVDQIEKAVKGKIDYYKPSQEGYPTRTDEIKKVEASKEQVNYYKGVTRKANPILAWKIKRNMPLSKQESKDLNAFMSAARQVSNTTTPYGGKEEVSPKIKTVVDDFSKSLAANPKSKSLIYSNYIGAGLDPVAKQFDARKIPYSRFVGGMSDKDRKLSIDNYNSGISKALLVSKSGSEGLDLKGTRMIQIMEPHWNTNRLEQVIGRGVRYKSHEALPEADRTVKVVKYQTTLPKTFVQKILHQKPNTSTDEYLEQLSQKKQRLMNRFVDVLKDDSNE